MLNKNTGLISIRSEERQIETKNDVRYTSNRKKHCVLNGYIYIKASDIEKIGLKVGG